MSVKIRKYDEDSWKEDCYQYVYNLTKDMIIEFYDLFFDTTIKYNYEVDMEISIFIDPYGDDMYNPKHLLRINDKIEISVRPDIEFMGSYISTKNWTLIDKNDLIYSIRVKSRGMKSGYGPWLVLPAATGEFADIVSDYINRLEIIYKADFYRGKSNPMLYVDNTSRKYFIENYFKLI